MPGAKRHSRGEAPRPGLFLLDDYFRGQPPLRWCPDGWEDSALEYLRMSRLNLAEITVSSVVDSMVPLAWSTAAEDDADGDQVAARISAENDLPLVFADAAQSSLTYGDGYAILGPSEDGQVPPITAESPIECITREDPITGRTLYGLKTLVDEWTGDDAWYLYGFDDRGGWVRRAVNGKGGRDWDGEREYIPGHGQWCAMHRVSNRYGVGEFERHLDTIDRIIDGVFSRICIAKFQAFRQRAIEGLPDTTTDDKGNEVRADYSQAFMADPGALWRIPQGAKIWESQPVDLGPIRSATQDDVRLYCGMTKSPIYYLFPDEQQSAQGAANMSQSHENRVKERRRRSEGFQSRIFAHAFEAMGDAKRADLGRIRVEWAPIREYSLQEQAQALPSFVAGKVPWEATLLRVLQVRPSELPKYEAMRDKDAFWAATQAAVEAPAAVGSGAA